MLRRIIGVSLLAVALVAVLLYSQWQAGPRIVSGLIEADEIRVGSRVGGRTLRVHVDEGDRVEAGALLVELDPFDLEDRRVEAASRLAAAAAEYDERAAGYRIEDVAAAKARRDQLAATLAKLVKGPRNEEIAAARAELDLAEAQRDLARTTSDRVAAAAAREAASAAEIDQAAEALKVAEARVHTRREQLNLLLEGTRPEEITEAEALLEQAEQEWLRLERGYRPEVIARAKAARDAAAAALGAIERQIEETQIRAPQASVVEAIDLEPGDIVAPNAPALALLDLTRLWVRAYVPETALDLDRGDRLWVTVDAYPGERFAGHVTFIAREAEFTPRNVQTPEERSKQVFRVKVQLDDGLDRLRPGMFADVHLDDRPPAAPDESRGP